MAGFKRALAVKNPVVVVGERLGAPAKDREETGGRSKPLPYERKSGLFHAFLSAPLHK